MSHHDLHGTDWSDNEIDLIVADYFEMLGCELSRQSYIKAHHNAALQEITGRKRGSIEFKHQNISAVLLRLGLPWIPGYKPMANFQNALIDGIGRFLSARGDITPVYAVSQAVAEEHALWFGPPPAFQQQDEAEATESLKRLVRKFDPAERDARNRELGKRGEALVFEHERRRLTAGGRDDLARRLRWTSQEDGDGAGYDIRSFELNGRDRLIEVKTTIGHALTPFFISENERSFSEERMDAFRLLRLYDFAQKPSAFELSPPLGDWIRLNPAVYRAHF
ncbi:MAG: DUF3883 domain-containing protein [Sphingomonadaceae bacterium]|nr:DUF3883 domain-containing protein [Sphingomonadaceae bacterium]